MLFNKQTILTYCWYLCVLLHYFVFGSLIYSIFVLPFTEMPWFVIIIMETVIVRIAFSPTICPLSLLECSIAKRINYHEYKWFVKQHVIPETKWVFNKIKEKLS